MRNLNLVPDTKEALEKHMDRIQELGAAQTPEERKRIMDEAGLEFPEENKSEDDDAEEEAENEASAFSLRK